MSKRSLLLLLVFWNTLLTAAVVWSLSRPRVPDRILEQKLGNLQVAKDSMVSPVPVMPDTSAIPEGRIAFFMMDSVQAHYELVKESQDKVRSEGQRLEGNLQREMQKAQARYAQLMNKDHTYSTQAELKADQDELEQLGAKIQQLQADSQERLDELQTKALIEITGQIRQFLEEYNKTAGFDYIFSIQDAGQIWVGNQALDITPALVSGLNAKHRQRKGTQGK
ncbi:MAG: OmpH family outer membrane protein [Flavobacteriales bacterium]|nr:OmpH family outer membrane protein [Flavobacteriales bacterium]